MNKFRFNTGVNINDNPHIPGGIDSGNGIVVIKNMGLIIK